MLKDRQRELQQRVAQVSQMVVLLLSSLLLLKDHSKVSTKYLVSIPIPTIPLTKWAQNKDRYFRFGLKYARNHIFTDLGGKGKSSFFVCECLVLCFVLFCESFGTSSNGQWSLCVSSPNTFYAASRRSRGDILDVSCLECVSDLRHF